MRTLLVLLCLLSSFMLRAQNAGQDVLLNKSFNMRTGQGYIRQVERYYFGPRFEAAELFRKNNHRKGINQLNYNKFPRAPFYAEGVFKMSEEKKQQARDLFRPLLDSVLARAAKSENRHAEILLYGYTDETPIDWEGSSYRDVCAAMKRESLNETEYRNAISYLRAADLASVIRGLIEEQPEAMKAFRRCLLDVYIEGRGMEFPDPTRQYDDEDDKRKIVKVFWMLRP